MRAVTAVVAVGALAAQASAVPSVQAKNVIYIVPDGYGPASQTMARDLASLIEGGSASSPSISELPVDELAVGHVRTHSANRMITDSAASGTAFATGHKSNNGAISVLPDGRPVGSILEAAKAAGLCTGLVVTSIINHATPAVYAAHAANRNDYNLIAEHEIGYSHPLGPQVDVLFGGGRCYFRPQNATNTCRQDDTDLFGWAEGQGWTVAQNRSAFDALGKGLGEARLPLLGLFNDGDLEYEMDRNPDEEPSLLEMTETALNALHRGTHCKEKGYFIMIEASRIDHAGHAGDPAAHAVDTWMYNDVIAYVRDWIDEHPDTILMSAADHETGGLTLNGYDPRPAAAANNSAPYLESVWRDRSSSVNDRDYLVSEILPSYGLSDASDAEISGILDAGDSIAGPLSRILSRRAGVNWSTGGHSAVDVTLFGYAAQEQRRALQADLAGGWDNTELPRYIEEVLGLDMDAVTEKLREAAAADGSWMESRGLEVRGLDDDPEHHH